MRKLTLVLLIGLMALSMGMYGCSGDDGDDGAAGPAGLSAFEIAQNNGYTGTEAEFAAALNAANDATPESCAVCHNGAGDLHQANYNGYSNPTTLGATITSVVSTSLGTNPQTWDTVATFTITKDAAAYDQPIDAAGKITGLDQQRFMFVVYDGPTRTFDFTGSFGSAASLGGGTYTVTSAAVDHDITAENSVVYMYFAQTPIAGTTFGHIQLYEDVVNVGFTSGTVDYVTAADVAGCEKCHGAPYLKHGYRGAEATNLPTFASCKTCHYDTRPGHSAAEFFGDATYTYTANVMTDVHATHNNVFPYPQEMANCVTCHVGAKLAATTTDANFRRAVCETCHADVDPLTNTVVKLPLSTIVPSWHDLSTIGECNTCHSAGGSGPVFSTIHGGFDTVKYTSAADADAGVLLTYTYSIDDVIYDATASTLTITWGAKDASSVAQDVLNLDPLAGPVFLGLPADRSNESEGIRIMVGYYGWGSNNIGNYDNYRKDDILANTTYDNALGTATTVFTLTDKLTTYQTSKIEVGIIGVPLVNGTTLGDGTMVAVKSVTKGIVLADGTLEDRVSAVDNAKCNACHDNIVIHTNSSHGHTAVGNANACIFCHNTSSAAHVEQQGRSIDSYLHSIHTFQTEPEFIFPMFTTTNCEACHVAGKYNVPDQTKSLGSMIDNGSDDVTVGPASRACGSCHRAQTIKDADPGSLAAINAHTETNGYRVPSSIKSFVDVMNAIMDKL